MSSSPTTPIPNAVIEKVREARELYADTRDGVWEYKDEAMAGKVAAQMRSAEEWVAIGISEGLSCYPTALNVFVQRIQQDAIAATQPTDTGKSAEFSDAVKAATLEILELVNQGRAGKTIFQGDIAKIIQRCAPPEPRNGWQPRPLRELIAEGCEQFWVWTSPAATDTTGGDNKNRWMILQMFNVRFCEHFGIQIMDCPAIAIIKPASPPCVGVGK